jgi:S-DNA-T family DNA segregation ATPase FtsK/SpoIIIE
VTGYRQIRRQTRRARRAGLQPIVVIDTPFPTPAALIFARLAWRYRSEIAPATTAGAVLAAGGWMHTVHPHGWWFALAVSDLAAAGLAAFGARVGLDRLAERVYASVVVLVAGAWLATATILGPLTSPLPQALGLGALLLAVPWWAHRRRRARVRVQRALAAWPDISKAIGLPGSKFQSASVDLWGWRARIRLARGQTIADMTARIPAIESALGTYRGAVRVYPTGDRKANRCELRVLDTDPHAEAIRWPGPSARSIAQPVDLGPFEDAEPCRVSFLRRHALFAGTTGSGKSGGLNVLMATLAACDDVVIWAIDLKQGMELQPWRPCIGRLATTPEEAAALLADAVAIQQARAAHLAATGRRVWEPSPEMPALVIIVDEYAELADESPDAMSDTDSIARLGRAVAVTLVAATQRPTQKAMGQGAVRSQMDTRICFRVRERRDVDLILGQGMLSAGWHAHSLNAPGKFLVSAPEHTTPKHARAYLVTDDDVARIIARYGPGRPQLDEVSQRAVGSGPSGAEQDPGSSGDSYRHDGHGSQDGPDESTAARDSYDETTPDGALWLALCTAPDYGADIADLMRLSGMTRPTLYRHLAAHADARRAVQVSRGRWRATTTEETL